MPLSRFRKSGFRVKARTSAFGESKGIRFAEA
jgi:hypothetical protein